MGGSLLYFDGFMFDKISSGEFDPTEIITHKVPLNQASDADKIFNEHEDEVIKVVLKP